jgi:hypothetical protein
VKLETLQTLSDDDLRSIIARAQELLEQHDRQRKDEALEKARVILAGAGLTLRDVAGGKGHKNGSKGPVYHRGHQYQHPTNKALTWGAKGKKPHWLCDLEEEGKKAVEVRNA